MKKRILSLALASAMAVGTVSGAFAETEAVEVKTSPQYINGYEDGTFRSVSHVSRAEIAKMVAMLQGLEETEESFDDVPNTHWAAGFIGAVQEAGIVEGDDLGNFNPTEGLTRAELATIVSRVIEDSEGEGTEFSDVEGHWAADAIAKVSAAGIINGYPDGSFKPNASVTRAEAVKMLNAGLLGMLEIEDGAVSDVVENPFSDDLGWAEEHILAASAEFEYTLEDGKLVVKGEEEELAVESVSAINATTLQIKGSKLGDLKAADITVAGNTVSSVTASEDGKTATVALGTVLSPLSETAVTVKVGEETKSFTVSYQVAVSQVAVKSATYDNDTPNQRVAITVNGADTTIAELLANGYSATFTAKDSNGINATSTLFSNPSTGALNTGLTADKNYEVQVVITNGTDSIVSPLQTIKIMNTKLAATAINSYDLVLTTGGNNVILNSGKLVVGDQANVKSLKVVVDGVEQKYAAPTLVESSNPAVASISSADKLTINANTPGTTTLTIHYGNAKKEVSLTVANEARELKSVKVTKTGSNDSISSTTVVGTAGTSNQKLDLYPLDQYGDPMASTAVAVSSTDAAVLTVESSPASITSGTDGKAILSIDAIKGGIASIVFKENVTNGKVVGTLNATVTTDLGIASKKLEVVAPKSSDLYDKSADNTLDLSADNLVEYKLNQYNAAGVLISAADLTGYTATSTDTRIATATPRVNGAGGADNSVLTINAVKKGTATITLKDAIGTVVGTISVTVTDSGISITGVNFKTVSTLNYGQDVEYKTFLNYTDAGSNDPIISGITLSKATSNSVRLNVATGKLYLDQNGDAKFNAVTSTDDKVIGEISLTKTTDSTIAGTISANKVTIASGDKGTLIFKVQESGATVPTIYGSTSASVNVPTASVDAAAVAADKAALSVTYNGTDTSVTLPTSISGGEGSTISWAEKTDSSNVASLSGNTLSISRDIANNVDDTVVLTATISKNGATDTKDITLTVKEAKSPTAGIPLATGANNSATTLVVTFDEALYIGGTAVANNADIKTSFTIGGTTPGTTSITSAVYNDTAKTVTFTIANVDNADTITANASTLKDVAGNAYVAETMTYATVGTIWTK